MKRTFSFKKSILLIAVTAGLFAILLLFAICASLSPAGLQKISHYVDKTYLRPHGYILTVESYQFEPFSHRLFLRNLKLSWGQGLHAGTFSLDLLDVTYDLSLMQRTLRISNFLLDHPHLAGQLPESASKNESETNKKPVDLEKLVNSPPIRLIVDHFFLKDLEVDLQTGTKTVLIQKLNLNSSLHLVPQDLKLQNRLDCGPRIQIAMQNQFATELKCKMDLEIGITQNEGNWNYDVHTQDLNAEVGSFSFQKGTEAIHWNKLTLGKASQDDVRLHLQSQKLFALEGSNAVDKAACAIKAKLSELKITGKQALSLKSIDASLQMRLNENLQIDLHLPVQGLQNADYFYHPINLDLVSHATLTRGLDKMQNLNELRWENSGKPFLAFGFSFAKQKSPQAFQFSSVGSLLDLQEISSRLKAAKSLKVLGSPQMKWNFSGALRQARSTSEAETEAKPSKMLIELNGSVSSTSLPIGKAITTGGFELITNSTFEKLDNEFASRGKSRFRWTSRPKLPKLPMPFDFSSEITFDHQISQTADKKRQISFTLRHPQLKMDLAAQILASGDFTFSKLQGELGENLFSMSGEARGNTIRKDAAASIILQTGLPQNIDLIREQGISGRIAVPIQLSLRQGKTLSVSGEVGFTNVDYKKTNFGIAAINGKIPFAEELLIDGHNFSFSETLEQNPFERVNFERVQPLLASAHTLTAKSINWFERSYGPFIGYFSIKQNLMMIQRFNLDLGEGRLSGEFFLNLFPKNLRLGILARLTALDLGKFLPAIYLKKLPAGNRVVSGRTGMVFDINRNTVDGRIDITSIGAPQLSAMLNVLDPTFSNEKMNTIRKLLAIGYPTEVAISMAQGYMELDLNLRTIGVNSRHSLQGIPIGSLIAKATGKLVQETQKGPLR